MPSLYLPTSHLSASYTLGDLTLTNQNLTEPNLPPNSWQFDNLILLADMLEQLDFTVGPFTLISAFRTHELQEKLAAQGEPTGSSMSFHEAGRAVDIAPTTMGLTEYFGKLLANEDLRLQFSEISIKPSQGSIHLAINVPGDVREPKILGLNSSQEYTRLSSSDIESYVAPFLEAAGETMEQVSDYASQIAGKSKVPLIVGASILGGLAIFLAARKGPKTA
jgi:hypothetical protein